MCLHRVYHFGIFFVFLTYLNTDNYMASLNFMSKRLAYVVKKTGASRHSRVYAQLAGHDTRQVRHLYGMYQNVLTVRSSEMQPSKQFYQFRAETVDIGFETGVLALSLDFLLNLAFRLLYHFLNARGMNSAVLNKSFKGNSRDLSAYLIMAGKRDSLRSIVYYEINPCELFKSTYIASFPADYSSLHFVVGQRHHRHGHFRHRFRRQPRNSQRYHGTRPIIAVVLKLLLIRQHLYRFFMGKLTVKLRQKKLLSLFGSIPADFLKLCLLLFLQCLRLRKFLFGIFVA